MKLIVLSLCLFIISGCATTDWNSFWYGKPTSSIYYYGAHCEKCNRIFSVTSQQLTNEQIICPYCGYTQNLQYALNRYSYYASQVQSQQSYDYMSGVAEALRSGVQTQTHYQEKTIDAVLDRVRNKSSYRTHCYSIGNDIYCDTR
jgi:hypothetical protein